jgi:uncharacterized membrane protein SpoIIM required for sporulation
MSRAVTEVAVQRWIKARSPAWGRMLEDSRIPAKALDERAAVQRVRDYRELARDVSLARREMAGTSLVARLEALFRALHTNLHNGHEPALVRLRRLYAEQVPQSLHRLRNILAAITALFFASALASAWLVGTYPELAGLFVSNHMVETVEQGRLWTDDVMSLVPASVVQARIIYNNVAISLFAFALGALYGLGTFYIVAFNGAMLGGVLAFTHHHGMAKALLSFVLPHGVVEISVILLAAAAGVRIGEALVRPGMHSRAEAMRLASHEAASLLAIVVPGLFVAGTIEAFVSPSPVFGWAPRIAVAAASGFLLWSALSGKLVKPSTFDLPTRE